MIPPEKEAEKTVIESFMDSMSSPSYDRETQFKKMIGAVFAAGCDAAESYEEWHRYLSSYGIILVRARNLREIYKERWHSWAVGRFFIIKNPAEKEHEELMLVPKRTVEKMILLGMLKSGDGK